MDKKKLAHKGLVAAAVLAAAGGAMAQSTGIDVSVVTTGIDQAKTAITTVGGALIGLAVVVMTYRWIKGFVAGG
ncbi:major capsid protein [Variovorax sp.]|jgi:maltose-binding protein MalE|uniref:major capsid protein n=1 Tax=Variovorax sp. TaxID=1871043 RepID=UPI00403838F0